MKSIYQHINKLLAMLLIVFSYNISHAQITNLKGIVTDLETRMPMENVVVSIEKTNSHSHTDISGNYYFLDIQPGTYEVDFNKIGFDRKKVTIRITAGEVKIVNISMLFRALNLPAVGIEMDRPVTAASSVYLSQLDFENRPKNSAQDMLRLVPGLFIAQHAGGGKAEQILIRGFDCDHGTDVATYVDGIPVNMPSHGHGQGYMDLHFLIPETVSGMEIFKGPYSPLYGNFATGAAVKFNTLDSLQNNLIQLESGFVPEAGEITATRGLAMFKMPIVSNKISSYLATEVINNRGYFETSQLFKRVNVFSKTTFAITDRSQLQFSVSGFGSSWDASGQIPERAIRNGLITRFGSIVDTEGGTTQRNNINLIYKTRQANSDFVTQVYASDYRFKLFSNFTFFLNDPINGDEIEQVDQRTVRGFNAHYTFGHKIGKLDNSFTIGVFYRSDNIENELWKTKDRNRLEARARAFVHERATGLFANEVFRFNEKFRLELGGRFDYFIFDVEDLLPTDSLHQNYSGYNYQTLVSPKINFSYSPSNRLQFFLNAGNGFHTNDARSVVQQPRNHQLPLAPGAEIGSLINLSNRLVISVAAWWLELENELVYVGDDGTTENKGASRRIGIDFSGRLQIAKWLFADGDINISKNRFIDKIYGVNLKNDFYIPLAPIVSSSGGLTAKVNDNLEIGVRYRYLADRPANETNTIKARGYTIVDATANYNYKNIKLGLVIENLTNREWNEAQFATETRLFNETTSVDELHFTPGTPFSAKLTVGYLF